MNLEEFIRAAARDFILFGNVTIRTAQGQEAVIIPRAIGGDVAYWDKFRKVEEKKVDWAQEGF